MHSLQLTQESLLLLMQVKRILKSDYDIRINLQHDNLGDELANAISESHDESLYMMVHSLWEDLSKSNRDKEARQELEINQSKLEAAWEDQVMH